MLPQSLGVVSLVWLDGLYEIQVEAVLLVQMELLGIKALQAGQNVRNASVLQVVQDH